MLLGVGLGVPSVWLSLAALSRSPANTKVDVPLNQPVPFSHQHHVTELGIDCRYCHTAVEKSSFAGLPSTETCMSCHSQIWTNSPLLEPVRQSYETGTPIKWNLVNSVPQFVFFNHSIHIARGLNCNTCHGPIQNMNMTWKGNSFQMDWCLQCHRAPERYLHDVKPNEDPRKQVFSLYWRYQQHGTKGMSFDDQMRIRGHFNGSDSKADKETGKEVVSQLGIKVQQLSDCNICHR
ncbi:MAG TPA: cytochrome c3 family protein [Fimbriimonas sp.]|nr:cytochrome c3 family protein [Fimbriimonas sp.]